MADEDMREELERLRAENEALKAKTTRERTLKVSQKGGVSVYGIRRFPVTFSADAWDIRLGRSAESRASIRETAGAHKRR